jgi:hypothetical protein
MAKEKVYAKKGLFGTTIFVNKQGKFVGKSYPNSNSNLIRDSKGRVTGKAYGNFGVNFSSDRDND